MEAEASPERPAVVEPDRALYGALVAASTLVAAAGHIEDYRSLAAAMLVAVVVFWLAHVYIQAQTVEVRSRAHVGTRVRVAAGSEIGVVVGGLPTIFVYVGGVLVGLSKADAATVAEWFTVTVLVAVGYLTARRAGVHGAWALVDCCIAGLLGIVVVVGKAALH